MYNELMLLFNYSCVVINTYADMYAHQLGTNMQYGPHFTTTQHFMDENHTILIAELLQNVCLSIRVSARTKICKFCKLRVKSEHIFAESADSDQILQLRPY